MIRCVGIMRLEQSQENGGAIFSGFVWMYRLLTRFILEKKAQNHKSRTQLAFQVELAKDLIGNFSNRGRTASSGQSEAGHWAIPFPKGRCKQCLKRKKTTFCRMGCQRCNKRVCLECFANHIGDLG